jgi:hypothetical protein
MQWITAAALALVAAGAVAGQITLYERQDFQGRSIVTTDGLAVVARPGFDNAASSIVVADGMWEACNDGYFRGRCVMLRPGNYPRLDIDLNGRIASLRQVGYVASATSVVVNSQPVTVNPAPVVINPPQVVINPAPIVINAAPVAVTSQPVLIAPQEVALLTPAPIGRAVLYEYPSFGGTAVSVDRGQANDLDWANFSSANKRAASIRVESGTWMVCSELGFQGECRILGPGEYPRLSGSLAGGISSARQVWRPEYGAMNTYSR